MSIDLRHLRKLNVDKLSTNQDAICSPMATISEFPRYIYNASTVNTHNTLTLFVEDVKRCIVGQKQYLCETHGSSSIKACSGCVAKRDTTDPVVYLCEFHGISNVKTSECCDDFFMSHLHFLLTNNYIAVYIPPPIIMAKNNLSYFKTFIENFSRVSDVESMKLLMTKYKTFMEKPSFRGGYLSKQLSGKTSYLKINCLGTSVNSLRGTLIVSPYTLPNEISIPKSLYDSLDLAFDYVLLNRDPSINSRSMYVCTLGYHEGHDDSTFRINQYVLEGLHGDQDGDEVNIFYVNKEAPSVLLYMSRYELERKSWDRGFRHDVLGRPRYKFSQLQVLMLYKHHEDLCKLSPFWASIKRKLNTFWDLACSTHRTEADEFLRIFSDYCRRNDFPLVTVDDLVSGSGIFEDIVKSGAKGSQAHIDAYRKNLMTRNEAELVREAKVTFDKYVTSNREMQKVGRQTSGSLHVYQNVVLINGTLQMNGATLVENIFDISLPSIFLYRPNTINYHVDQFLEQHSMWNDVI